MCMKASRFFRPHACAAALLLLIGALTNNSFAAPGDLDLSFDPGSVVNGRIAAIARQADGKFVIGGDFTTVRGLARSKLARLNADGSGDSSFAGGVQPESVHALALQPDGKILVGHQQGIVRLNSDGTQDTNFNAAIDTTFSDYASIVSIIVQPDARVLVGGSFYTMHGANVYSGVARLNSNGSFDASFNPFSEIPLNGVTAIALQTDGKVLTSGSFYLNESNRFGIVRLNANGTLDNSFNPTDASVQTIALQADGKVLVGGYFDGINGTNRSRIARLNSNGSLDASFASAITNAINSWVAALAVQPDGKILAGGWFSLASGTNRNVARLNTDGTLDATFSADATDIVDALTLQPDGKSLIAGGFTTVNAMNRNHVARLNGNGSLDHSFNPGPGIDGSVGAIVVQPDGKALVGGAFRTVKNVSSPTVARVNADGNGDSSFNARMLFGEAYSMTLQSDGKVLVAGLLPGSSTSYGFVRLHADGSLDNSFHPFIGTPNSPEDIVVATAVAVQSDGRVLVGGFTQDYQCDDQGCLLFSWYFLSRLNADGSRDPNFMITDVGLVAVIALQPDGKVLVGGSLADETNSVGILRLNANGSRDTTFNPGAVRTIDDMAVQPDGKILFGGTFTATNGTTRRALARLNSNGTLDNSFTPATITLPILTVRSIALQPDGKAIVAGTSSGSAAFRDEVARFNSDGTLDNTFNVATVTNGGISTVALQHDGNVLVGGWFMNLNGVFRPFLARLYGSGAAAPLLNITRSNSLAVLSWPAAFGNFQLQESTNLPLPNGWSAASSPRSTNNSLISVPLPASGSRKFFRLSSP
jgi:uncharacterized delta-60 repeat protein